MLRRSLFLALASLALFSVVLADESDVLKLTKDNFADVLAKESLVFVKFFAPWCGHCQAMAEDFKKVATELKGKAILADVDATIEEELAKKYNIEGFPTLKLFSNGEELTDYNGGRDRESMVKFIERASLPPFSEIGDADAFKKLKEDNKDKNLLIGSEIDEATTALFRKATFTLRDVMQDTIEFGVSTSTAHVDVEGVTAGDIHLLRLEADGSYKAIKYDSAAGTSIEKFVKAVALPAFQEFTQENAELYTDLSMPLVVGFYKDCEGEQCKALEKIALSKKDNGKVAFAWVNSVTLSSFQDYVGLKDAEVPICAYAFESDARYVVDDYIKEFSYEALEKWVNALIANDVKPARKSEAIPDAADNPGPVYNVVGDSWADVVEDTEKDVLIAQVAEWCGHCARLKPIYKKVAEALKEAGVDHIKLTMMDATENDAPEGYKARGFPTIFFFPAGKEQKGISFEGDRGSKGIIEWLQEHTTKKFEFDTSTLGEDPEPEEEEDDGDDDEFDDEAEDDEDVANNEDDADDEDDGEADEGEDNAGEEKEEL